MEEKIRKKRGILKTRRNKRGGYSLKGKEEEESYTSDIIRGFVERKKKVDVLCEEGEEEKEEKKEKRRDMKEG